MAGITAYQALKRLEVKEGTKLLIVGGAGGVGTFAIQIARILGADITTTGTILSSSTYSYLNFQF